MTEGTTVEGQALAESQPASLLTQSRLSCRLHSGVASKPLCHGHLTRGGRCKKAAAVFRADHLPMCKIHQGQLIRQDQCRGALECGCICNSLFVWQPHGFHLCPIHENLPRSCHFLELPPEIRLRIYELLLPDKPIEPTHNRLRSDGKSAAASMIRINRQIHDEVADLLYSRNSFIISLSQGHFRIGRDTSRDIRGLRLFPWTAGESNFALQDYQMQLMLLEQQNKKRLLMARSSQAGHYHVTQNSLNSPLQFQNQFQRYLSQQTALVSEEINGSGSRQTSIQTTESVAKASEEQIISCPTEQPNPSNVETNSVETYSPVWSPSFSSRYFNMIRSFFIKIEFNAHCPTSPPNRRGHNALESDLYNYCDDLHRLVGRLRLHKVSIINLEVSVSFSCSYRDSPDVAGAAQLLLRPFRRLRNIRNPKVVSITYQDFGGSNRDILAPNMNWFPGTSTLRNFLRNWHQDITSTEAALESQAFKAYWPLEQALRKACEKHDPAFRYKGLMPIDLVLNAKVAREADDITPLQEIHDALQNMWARHWELQTQLQQSIIQSMNIVNRVLNDNFELSPTSSPATISHRQGKAKANIINDSDTITDNSPADSFIWEDEEGTRYFADGDKLRKELLTPVSLQRRQGDVT